MEPCQLPLWQWLRLFHTSPRFASKEPKHTILVPFLSQKLLGFVSSLLPVFCQSSRNAAAAALSWTASQLALASSFFISFIFNLLPGRLLVTLADFVPKLLFRQLAFFQSGYCILRFLVNLEPRGSQGQTRFRRSFCGILLLCFCWSSFFCWICFMALSQAFSFFCFFLLWGCCSGTWLLSWGVLFLHLLLSAWLSFKP